VKCGGPERFGWPWEVRLQKQRKEPFKKNLNVSKSERKREGEKHSSTSI
jgi:hypothetical protein